MALVWLRAYPTYEVLGLCFGLHKRVATDLAAVPEIVVEGETGFLVDAGDVRGLIEGLRTLVLDPELHGRMGASPGNTWKGTTTRAATETGSSPACVKRPGCEAGPDRLTRPLHRHSVAGRSRDWHLARVSPDQVQDVMLHPFLTCHSCDFISPDHGLGRRVRGPRLGGWAPR